MGLRITQNVAAVHAYRNLTVTDGHVSTVSTSRANLVADQNRLEQMMANLAVIAENLSASESRIRADGALLSQANQAPREVLQLLRG